MSTEHNLNPRAMSLAVHELRTPVSVVSGYLRMLLREQAGPLTDKQRKILEEIDKSSTRLVSVVNEISELGRLEAGDIPCVRQEFDLGTLAKEVASGMHEGEDRGVTLDLRQTDHPTPVAGDRQRLSAALHVLMRSALRERGAPGTVIVASEIINGTNGQVWAVLAIGGDAEVSSLLAHAAAPVPPRFAEWRGGLGMALPIARRVIEMHGGALWSDTGVAEAEDNLNKGAGERRTISAASALRLPLRA